MRTDIRIHSGAMALLAGALLLAAQSAAAQQGPIRIVVLPFYTEEGADVTDAGYEARHYRRIIRFINNQLVRHEFEVVSAHATELKEEEYNRLRERAREDSSLAAREMTRKYAVDVAYVVWLDVSKRTTGDGYCRAKARVEGEGYDSGSRDIGAGVLKTFTLTRRDCDDAVIEAEVEVGDEVGRTLTAWRGRSARSTVVSGAGSTAGGSGEGGVIQREAEALGSLINLRLEGATEYELVEVFGKVLHTVRGVTEAKIYRTKIEPGNPQASLALWRVRIEDTTTFRLQSNVMTMLKSICDAGGELVLKGVAYRYTPAEVDRLKGVFAYDVTSRELAFRVDRERVRDLEMRGVECWG